MQVFVLRSSRKDLIQSERWASEGAFFNKFPFIECFLEVVIAWERNFPDNKFVSINVVKFIWLLSPDGFLEGTDIVVVWYLYSKDVTGIIAENQAVELKD